MAEQNIKKNINPLMTDGGTSAALAGLGDLQTLVNARLGFASRNYKKKFYEILQLTHASFAMSKQLKLPFVTIL